MTSKNDDGAPGQRDAAEIENLSRHQAAECADGTALTPPALSDFGRRTLAEIHRSDRDLYPQIGMTLGEALLHIDGLDYGGREDLMIDGLRWRHHWSPRQVAWRAECEAAEQRRDMIESSHAISAAIGGRWGPSHAELQRLRAIPVVPTRCARPGCTQVVSAPYPRPPVVWCPAHASYGREAAA